ncbi:hypothetical protein OF83DRAFT_1141126 [Amylostereum chailletii]|nr:hypothetical protein OF83DRAFT_1141126 [Amylostereum chailletii]
MSLLFLSFLSLSSSPSQTPSHSLVCRLSAPPILASSAPGQSGSSSSSADHALSNIAISVGTYVLKDLDKNRDDGETDLAFGEFWTPYAGPGDFTLCGTTPTFVVSQDCLSAAWTVVSISETLSREETKGLASFNCKTYQLCKI